MLIFELLFEKLIYQNLLVIFGNNETDGHSKALIFFYALIQLIENLGLSTDFTSVQLLTKVRCLRLMQATRS